MVTVTSSPALKVCLLHPRSIMSGPLVVSVTQLTTLPLSSFTSNFRKQWGLAQNHSVTVPLRVSLFPVSNAELPWCANDGTDTINTPRARARTVKNLTFTSDLHVATGHTPISQSARREFQDSFSSASKCSYFATVPL